MAFRVSEVPWVGSSRRRPTVARQLIGPDSGGGSLAYCTFWLPPNMPAKTLYAMTAYAATEWTAPEIIVSPQTAGAQGDNGGSSSIR